MDTKALKGLAIGLVIGALAFGGLTVAQAAAPAALGTVAGIAAQAPPTVRPYLLGPLGVLAKLTGMDVDAIVAQQRAGKSLVDIAKSKSVSEDQLLDSVIAGRKAALDVRVKQGVITQQQADEILKSMRERMKQRFESDRPGPGFGGRGGCGGFGGRGARGRLGGPGLGSAPTGTAGPGGGFGPMMGGFADI